MSVAKVYAGAFSHPNGDSVGSNAFFRVKNNGGNIALSGASPDEDIGILAARVETTDNVASVEPLVPGYVYQVVAAGAITKNANVYAAASGKVSATQSGRKLFRAMEAASGDGSIIRAQYLPGVESGVVVKEVTFTEDGDTTYTGAVDIPAGATLLDVIVHAVALWGDTTAATMDVGDAGDPNGIFAAINLKATDLLAGESISFGYTGGKEGADIDGGDTAGDHIRGRYYAAADAITGVVTTTDQDGTAGRTRMTVVYSLPEDVIAATGA